MSDGTALGERTAAAGSTTARLRVVNKCALAHPGRSLSVLPCWSITALPSCASFCYKRTASRCSVSVVKPPCTQYISNQYAESVPCSASFAARCASRTRRIRSLFCSRSRLLAANAFCAFASSSAVKNTSGLGGTKQSIKLKYMSTFCLRLPVDLSALWTTTFSINSLSIGEVSLSIIVRIKKKGARLYDNHRPALCKEVTYLKSHAQRYTMTYYILPCRYVSASLFVLDAPACKGKSSSGGVPHRLTGVSPHCRSDRAAPIV